MGATAGLIYYVDLRFARMLSFLNYLCICINIILSPEHSFFLLSSDFLFISTILFNFEENIRILMFIFMFLLSVYE